MKGGRVPLLSLNKLREKSQTTIILGKFVNKSYSDTYFVRRGRVPPLSLNEFREKSQRAIILGKFVNKPCSNSSWLKGFGNVHHRSRFKARFLGLSIFF